MVDTNAQIDAVSRRVRTATQDGEPTRVQTLAQTYQSPVDDVWEAVTSPDRIARWFLPVTGDLRLGGRYQLAGNAGGEILECVPPSGSTAHYAVTWEYGGGVTWLTIRLTGDRGGTRLELEHTGRVADVPAEFFEQFGSGATGVGWDQGLLGLALHLSGEAGIPPEDAEAWMIGEEGVRFARRAADAWGAADVADGADPAAATRAAAATFAFYTGQTPPEVP